VDINNSSVKNFSTVVIIHTPEGFVKAFCKKNQNICSNLRFSRDFFDFRPFWLTLIHVFRRKRTARSFQKKQ